MSRPRTERRAHARYEIQFDVETRDPGVVARLEARDLSLGGLYCASPTDFPEMTRLGVTLLLPNGNGSGKPMPLDVEAVVVRRTKLPSATGTPRYELGLYFTQMTDMQRERIARYLAQGS